MFGAVLSSVSVVGCHGANVETNYIPVGEALSFFCRFVSIVVAEKARD
jgi:hypothetical protein